MPILPEKIEIQGFFSFRQKTEINFQPLWQSGGLWGILGPNGAGKSSILDAMLLALYHKCPRSEGRERTNAIKTRGYKGTSEIMFQFRFRGSTYRCGFPSDKIRRLEENPPYSVQVLSGPEEVEKLLKLKYEDFLLGVVLPQGKFADLLSGTATRQVESLANLLPHRPWEEIEDKIKNTSIHLDKMYNSLEVQINGIQKQLQGLSDRSEEQLVELKNKLSQLQEQINSIMQSYNQTITQLNKAKERDEVQKKYQDLKSNIDKQSLSEEILDRIDAEVITKIVDLYNFQNQIKRESQYLSQLESEIKKMTQDIQKNDQVLKSILKDYDTLKPYYENQDDLNGISRIYNLYQDSRSSLKQYFNRIKSGIEELSLDIAIHDLTSNEQEISKFWESLYKEKNKTKYLEEKAQKEWQELRVSQALADYVRSLEEGEPCPVCGSTHHPRPRTIPDDLEVELKRAAEAYQQAQSKRQKIESIISMKSIWEENWRKYLLRKQEYQSEYDKLSSTISKEIIDKFLSQNIGSKLAEARVLHEKIRKYESSIGSLRIMIEEKSKQVQEIRDSMAEIQRKYDSINREMQQNLPDSHPFFRDFWHKARNGQIGSLTQWIQERRELLRQYGELSKQLSPGGEYYGLPETEKIMEKLRSEESLIRQKQNQISSINKNIGVIEREIEMRKNLQSELEVLEKQKEQVKREKTLIERVKKATEQGALKRFIIMEILMKGLVERMNSYLRDWLGVGSLQLRLPSEEGRPLVVEDPSYAPGEHRSTATLSGGEKFLVSLAMALSLSETLINFAQDGTGRNTESFFFIDEGFDTLSRENFALVMQTLQRLATEGKCIGLISHKIEAQDYLSAYLWVEKRGGTTHVEMGSF